MTNSTAHHTANRLEILTQELTSRIVGGEYSAGERLPTETQLQKQWGVSRSVVREAMKVLESQGLVRIEQGRGTFVSLSHTASLATQMTLALRRPLDGSTPAANEGVDEWAALLDVRRVLEVAVAERAARHADAAEVAAMQSAIDEMRERPAQPAGYVDADLAFHRALAAATGNALWSALLDSLNDMLRRYREVSFNGRDSALVAARQHQKILDAVQSRDVAGAVAAMRAHLRRSALDLKKEQTQVRKRETANGKQETGNQETKN
jgi:DNA-binding FadR family transcriptional regulator